MKFNTLQFKKILLNRRQFHLFISILLIHIFTSCSKHNENIATFTVSNRNFINSLTVEGVVEPLLSTTLVSPRYCDGVVEFLVEDGTYVEEGQVVCIIEFQELKNQYEQISIQLENAEAGLNKTRADLNMQYALIEAQVKTNDADTRIAQMDSVQIAYASLKERAIKELQLERALIEKTRFEKKLEALKVIQQSEIKKLELEIQRFRSRVQTMKEQLDALTIKAPKSGLMLRADSRLTGKKYQVGDPIWSNMPVATIPEMKEMKVKIMASESDFKIISVNDSVSYTFDAMPENTGSGKILKKSPVGQPYKKDGKVKFFEIEASLNDVLTLPEPGFTANCRIIFKQIENVITVPQIAIFNEDSIKVVFVQSKRGFEKRQVLTDISSPNESIITAGLTGGETVALSKPKTSLVKGIVALPDSLTVKPEAEPDSPLRGSPPDAVPAMPKMITQP